MRSAAAKSDGPEDSQQRENLHPILRRKCQRLDSDVVIIKAEDLPAEFKHLCFADIVCL